MIFTTLNMSTKINILKNKHFLILAFIFLFVGSSCQGPSGGSGSSSGPEPNGGEHNEPPVFDENGISWVVQNHHPSYWTKNGYEANYSSSIRVAISVDDKNGINDLSYVGFTNPENTEWVFKDSYYGINDYDAEKGYFGNLRCYKSSSPDKVMLGNYKASVIDTANNSVSKDFTVWGPNEDASHDFVYSEDYSGNTAGGIPNLKRAEYSNHTLGIDTISVDFSVNDSRVYNGYFWLYDNSQDYVGLTRFFRDAVNGGSGLKTDGSVNNFDFFGTDIKFSAGKTIDDVYGFHIVLVDGQQYGGAYYDYRSISEYQYAKWHGTFNSKMKRAKGIVIDDLGTIVLAGMEIIPIASNSTDSDIFVEKISPTGQSKWTRNLGLSDYNHLGHDYYGLKVDIDQSKNIYVSGTMSRYDTIDDVSDDSWTYRSALLRKYDSNGIKQWTRVVSGDSDDYNQALAVDGSGDIYIGGWTHSYTFDGIATHPNSNNDSFITKFNSSGDKIRTIIFGTHLDTELNGITTDNFGNVYATGRTEGDLFGQPNHGEVGTMDIFLSKFDSSGNHLMTRLFGGENIELNEEWEEGTAVTVDSSGDIFIVGHTSDDFNGQVRMGDNKDAFIVKMDKDGSIVWTRFISSLYEDKAYDVKTDGKGNVYVVGIVSGDIEGYILHGARPFVAKFNSEGTRLWFKIVSFEYGAALGLALSNEGDVFVTGHHRIKPQGKSGYYESIVAKYNPDGELLE